MRVASARSSACACGLGGQHAEDHGHAGLRARVHEAARALAGDEIEVRRVAADHAAERDDRVVRRRSRRTSCAASGSSNAPGTRSIEQARRHRRRARARPASRPSMSCSTSGALKRAATMATRQRARVELGDVVPGNRSWAREYTRR